MHPGTLISRGLIWKSISGANVMSNELYTHNEYLLRRKVLTFAGAKFHIYDPDGNLAFYS